MRSFSQIQKKSSFSVVGLCSKHAPNLAQLIATALVTATMALPQPSGAVGQTSEVSKIVLGEAGGGSFGSPGDCPQILNSSSLGGGSDKGDSGSAGAGLNLPNDFSPDAVPEEERAFAHMAKYWQDGWGMQGFWGFYGGAPKFSAESFAASMKHGLMHWRLRIFFMPDMDSARRHHLAVEDELVRGTYIIGDPGELNLPNEISDKPIPVSGAAFRVLVDRFGGMVVFDQEGREQRISAEAVHQRLDYREMTRVSPDHYTSGQPFFSHDGWVALKKVGVLSAESQNRSAQETRALARRLYAQGYRFKVNGDFVSSLNMVRDQDRKGRVSRYASSQALYDGAFAAFRSGRAFSVEVYSPEGRLLGGSLNFRSGNHIIGETVFYSTEPQDLVVNSKKGDTSLDPVELVKIADILFMDLLKAKGIPSINVGMVSKYSTSLHATYSPREEFLATHMPLQNQEPLLFPPELDPFMTHSDSFQPWAMKVLRQGLTAAKLVPNPVPPTPQNLELARRYLLRPEKMKIWPVESSGNQGSLREIETLAMQRREQGEYPIFVLVASDTMKSLRDPNLPPLTKKTLLLRELMSSGGYAFDRPLNGKSLLPERFLWFKAQRFSEVLGFSWGLSHGEWVVEEGGGERQFLMTLPAWAPQTVVE